MNEPLPPPDSTAPRRTPALVGVWMGCAFLILLTVLGAGGYLLRQELRAMANVKPVAPPEITQALAALKTSLEQQRRDYTRQLAAMQQELAALKEQQAAPPPAPDIAGTLAPLQQQLNAIAAQLAAPPPMPAPAPVAAPVAPTEEIPAPPPAPAAIDPHDEAWHALEQTIRAGEPYREPLDALLPTLPAHLQTSAALLQRYSEHGVPSAKQLRARQLAEATPTALPQWAQTLNERLPSLVRIKPSAPGISKEQEDALLQAQAVREDVLVALATIQAGRR